MTEKSVLKTMSMDESLYLFHYPKAPKIKLSYYPRVSSSASAEVSVSKASACKRIK